MRNRLQTSYRDDIRLFRWRHDLVWYGLLGLGLMLLPMVVPAFYVGELSFVFIYAIAGVGLMLLVGYTGLVSLGHAAFLGVGAYGHTWFIGHGVPFLPSMVLAGLLAGVIGVAVGIPTLRMTGIYLSIATLAMGEIIGQVFIRWESVTGGFRGLPVPAPVVLGIDLGSGPRFYGLCLAVLVLVLLGARNLLRAPTGRSWVAVRDSEIAAQSMGVNLARTKTLAFAVSAAITGLAGALFAHKVGYLAPDIFTVLLSIQLLLLVVVGGVGSLHGAVFGALFVAVLPVIIAGVRDSLPAALGQQPGLEPGVFGLVLVLVILFEPLGIYGRWRKIRLYFSLFPSYRKATFKRQKAFLRSERLR